MNLILKMSEIDSLMKSYALLSNFQGVFSNSQNGADIQRVLATFAICCACSPYTQNMAGPGGRLQMLEAKITKIADTRNIIF